MSSLRKLNTQSVPCLVSTPRVLSKLIAVVSRCTHFAQSTHLKTLARVLDRLCRAIGSICFVLPPRDWLSMFCTTSKKRTICKKFIVIGFPLPPLCVLLCSIMMMQWATPTPNARPIPCSTPSSTRCRGPCRTAISLRPRTGVCKCSPSIKVDRCVCVLVRCVPQLVFKVRARITGFRPFISTIGQTFIRLCPKLSFCLNITQSRFPLLACFFLSRAFGCRNFPNAAFACVQRFNPRTLFLLKSCHFFGLKRTKHELESTNLSHPPTITLLQLFYLSCRYW